MLVAASAFIACGGDGGTSCRGTCVADPGAHCVSESDCERDGECPAGLRCAPADIAGACRRENDDDRVRCRPFGPQTFNAFTLREGFAVPELKLSLDETAQATFTWRAPSGARVVSCAVFRCAPVFADTGEESLDGTKPLRTIYNFDRCALIHRVMAADEGSFALAMTGEEYDRGEAEGACEAERSGSAGPEYTELMAGCWAYDTTRVVRASNLVPLRPDQVTGVALPGSSCGGDGVECYLEGTSAFGICLDGTCRSRCLTALDCELAAADPAAPSADAGPCGWECAEAGQWRACKPVTP